MLFKSPVALPYICSAFAAATAGARVHLNDIRYATEAGIVQIRMKQRELIGSRKSFWGRPIYHGQNWVNAVLTIRQVVTMKMEVDDLLVTKCNSCFTIMMGLKIDNNEMYLGSIEEARGKILCQVFITVREIDLEFVDHL